MKYEYQRRSVNTLNTRKAVLSTLAVSYQWTLSANICLPACLPVFPNASSNRIKSQAEERRANPLKHPHTPTPTQCSILTTLLLIRIRIRIHPILRQPPLLISIIPLLITTRPKRRIIRILSPLPLTSSNRILLIPHRRIIKRHTNRPAMMSIILPNNALTPQLPQPRVMITTRRHKIRAIGAKRAVPDPALVTLQRRLEREGGGVALRGGRQVVAWCCVVRQREIDGPYARRVVGGAGC
jgi:hypothetical protein